MPLNGRRRQALMLAGTLALASGTTAGIAAWVLAADPTVGVSEGLRTGGLAGASIVALYALWLNDRRRRVEEDRQAVEEERLDTERLRIIDERFAKAVEMLGHDADQVRVGAMHALAGLARSTPSYTQTVIDVLCAYLRRPFFHYSYVRADPSTNRSDFAESALSRLSEEEAADDRERQARSTALRLAFDLLPAVGSDELPHHLDLTGAVLEFFDVRQKKVGLIARRATFYGVTRLSSAHFASPTLLTGCVFRGRVELGGARFSGGLSLHNARFDATVAMTGAVVEDFADLRWTEPAAVDLTGLRVGPDVRLKLLPGTELAPTG